MATKKAIKVTLKKFEEEMESKKVDLTMAEYLKLLQVAQELTTEKRPKEIKVSWVDPAEPSNGE